MSPLNQWARGYLVRKLNYCPFEWHSLTILTVLLARLQYCLTMARSQTLLLYEEGLRPEKYISACMRGWVFCHSPIPTAVRIVKIRAPNLRILEIRHRKSAQRAANLAVFRFVSPLYTVICRMAYFRSAQNNSVGPNE